MKTTTHIKLDTHRGERLQQIRALFAEAAGPDLGQDLQGGRSFALQRLSQVDALAYAKTRNHLSGAVTRLSPYIRHGCVSVHEVIADLLARFGTASAKLVSELAYHDYFRQVWTRFGDAIVHEMEAPKVRLGQLPLPGYVTQGITGLVCMDEVVRLLLRDGYVHNHARMWFAAYIVHWLKVDWQQAAQWFEQQLLDGNIASNHLSWQWVASSFSAKPYYFNRENLQKFGGEHYCQQCKVRCPFDHSYEYLQRQLFAPESPAQGLGNAIQLSEAALPEAVSAPPEMVWVHDEMLSPTHPLLRLGLPAVFVFDPQLYGQWPRKRLQFMADCLAEMPMVSVWAGNTAEVFTQLGVRRIITQATPQTLLKQSVADMAVHWQPSPGLTDQVFDDEHLMRFSRYWKKVAPVIMGDFYTP